MTRERIEDFREIVLPFLSRTLLETNYENMGKSDAEEFTRDFNEILNLAIEALEQELSYNSVNSLVESKLKNPKAKTFDILHFVADNAGLSTFEAIEKAYNMGVSEQESVLDKLRAEILEYIDDLDIATEICGIFDKYKTESEGIRNGR